jgi:hypothetical protein
MILKLYLLKIAIKKIFKIISIGKAKVFCVGSGTGTEFLKRLVGSGYKTKSFDFITLIHRASLK